MAELHDLTAHELSLAFRTRRLSPVEATKAALHRIESWERHINAMYLVDMAGAMKQAREAEKRWRDGKPLSLLDGVPITIKENIATKGVPTPIGTAASPMTPAPADAPPAARVREAGCVILGKTTMPDFGMLASGVSSLHGISRNPWNLARNTAGSSSGAGAALAAGYGPLALGTDIGGSVRLPAAYTGTFALKPSLGRVPIHPPYLGRVTGPMTRTVQDAAMLLNHLSQPDPRDYMALPYEDRDWARSLDGEARGLRIGLMLDIGYGSAPQPAVRAAVIAAARLLEKHGATIVPIEPFLTEAMMQGLNTFFQARALADFELMTPEQQGKLLHFIADWCRDGKKITGAQAMRALGQVMAMREAACAACEPYDLVLSPTSPITAYAAEEAAPGNDVSKPFHHICFTAPFNMSEQPAASICCGQDEDGLPIGLQIIGHRFDDLGVLRLAAIYERLRPAPPAWPAPPA